MTDQELAPGVPADAQPMTVEEHRLADEEQCDECKRWKPRVGLMPCGDGRQCMDRSECDRFSGRVSTWGAHSH